MSNFIGKVFYFITYSISIFILLFILIIIIIIVLKINMNHINILYSLWIYNTGANMHIIYILNGYIKDRNIDPNNYIIIDEKSVKVDLYKMSIIVVDTLNDLDIIIFVDIVYYPIFLTNITLTKHFQFKGVYLNKEHSQLYKKKIIQYLLKEYNKNFFL